MLLVLYVSVFLNNLSVSESVYALCLPSVRLCLAVFICSRSRELVAEVQVQYNSIGVFLR